MKKLFLNSSKAFLIILFSSIIDVNADEIFIKGKEVFLGAGNCAACHTLAGFHARRQAVHHPR